MTHPTRRTLAAAAMSTLALTAVPGNMPRAAALAGCTYTASTSDNLAVVVDQQPSGATICLPDGNWELTRALAPKSGQTIIGTGRSVLEGSRRITSWRADGDVWAADGPLSNPNGSGECEDFSTLCDIPEDLYDGNVNLKRVGSRSAVGPGRYFADYGTNTLYVGGSDPSQHTYRLSSRTRAIQSTYPDITIRNVTVQGFANPAQQGAIQADGSRWVLDGVRVTQNHGAGIVFSGVTGGVVRNSEITENGQIGIIGSRASDTTIENSFVHDNNTSGFWIGDWEAGGIKFTGSTNTTLRSNVISANRGPGIWADLYCDGFTVDGNTVQSNKSDGIRFEISRNATITNNTFDGNALGVGRGGGTSIWAGGGIVVSTAQNVEVGGNELSGNQHGISVQSRNRGAGPWGTLTLSAVSVHDNTVDLTRAGADQGLVGDVDYWGALYGGGAARFNRNHYTVPASAPDRFASRWQVGDFAQWQSLGFDTDGSLSVR